MNATNLTGVWLHTITVSTLHCKPVQCSLLHCLDRRFFVEVLFKAFWCCQILIEEEEDIFFCEMSAHLNLPFSYFSPLKEQENHFLSYDCLVFFLLFITLSVSYKRMFQLWLPLELCKKLNAVCPTVKSEVSTIKLFSYIVRGTILVMYLGI